MKNTDQLLITWSRLIELDLSSKTLNDCKEAIQKKLKEITGDDYTLIKDK